MNEEPSNNQQYSAGRYRKCPHNRCLNHSPKWKKIGEPRTEPNPEFFGLKRTYWFMRCCGQAMQRSQVVQDQECELCGRRDIHVIESEMALCLCCGYHKTNHVRYGP